MKVKWDTTVSALLVVCALLTTSLVIYRTFMPSVTPRPQVEKRQARFISDWRSHLSEGILLGSSEAPVWIEEFADFECPFCATFHKTLKAIRERYPKQVSVVFVHFPLPMHRFAVPAARVAECAADQGRFEPMYDQLFDGQEFFGLKPWSDYAKAAGIQDLKGFDDCVKSEEPILRVLKGKQLGTRLDVTGTPTLIVNGWLLGQPPSEEELDTIVKAVLSGKVPVVGVGGPS